uniref:Translocase of outer mitochondrial membrane 20 like n=1 Tax=Chrysemys picta bellii TaxID=8478 RepID=A0A8C3ILE6_CHRPI
MSGWARPLLLLLAGACGLTLLGYAVYFDRQRRNAPDFKRKLRQREHKKSVEHLTNAISVCAQPHQLLQLLHNTLPPQVFEMLLQRVPYTKQVRMLLKS